MTGIAFHGALTFFDTTPADVAGQQRYSSSWLANETINFAFSPQHSDLNANRFIAYQQKRK